MKTRSTLSRYLWFWSAAALVLVWLLMAASTWSTGRHEAREITDGKLISVARLLLAPQDQQSLDTPSNQAAHRRDYAIELAVLRWEGGRLVEDTHGFATALGLRSPPTPGLSSVRVDPAHGQGEWRMYAATSPDNRQVAVLVDMEDRHRLNLELGQHVVLPVLVLLPLVMLALWWAVRRGLRPLGQLSDQVQSLDTAAGQRLDTEHRYQEFASTVSAINGMVDALQAQAQRERAFASDVAHELRTPLASIALGARAARAAPTAEVLDRLEEDALRAGRILQQLLDLARAQRDPPLSLTTTTDVCEVASSIIEAHVPLAYERDQELALQAPDHAVHLPVPRTLLELALRNLIDNAIRHTPTGTQIRVDIDHSGDSTVVSVSDDGGRVNGPPTPASGGLGLGLRLVERLAERMGARLESGHAQSPMTTRFALRWAGPETPTGSSST
ncbi:MAG: HAMP domain-containing histidine kinase [Burkholderiales bacterium]|nr:MAG: HAMP domain-containing histidine kinase [Burkholderiales bacterium]